MTPTVFRDVIAGKVQIDPITVEQYHQMIRAGGLPESTAYELISGFVVRNDRAARGGDPMSVGDDHSNCVTQLQDLNAAIRGHGFHLRTQQPLLIPPRHEPEPDGMIVKGAARDYKGRKPRPAEAPCVIEVADSSLLQDRTTKLAVYARAGIGQYVIVNIPDHVVEVYTRADRAAGRYRNLEVVRSNQSVTLLLGRGKSVAVAARELLP